MTNAMKYKHKELPLHLLFREVGIGKKLKNAYEEGGISAWAQTALRELEAEVEVERIKRDRETQDAASASGKMEHSPN
jgi:hypothetical protein